MLETAQAQAAVIREQNRQLERALLSVEPVMAASVDTFARLRCICVLKKPCKRALKRVL